MTVNDFYKLHIEKEGWNTIILDSFDFEQIRSSTELKFILSRKGMPFAGLFDFEIDDKYEYARNIHFVDGVEMYHCRKKKG